MVINTKGKKNTELNNIIENYYYDEDFGTYTYST